MTDSAYTNQRVASVYSRIAAPLQFQLPARDLVGILGPMEGARVLDVGTGTGAVALPAKAAAGSAGLVVGVDAAIEMLRFAREAANYPLAVAQMPELPFGDRVFDVVMAGFVVSHLPDYSRGLAEMVRVCRSGGKVGITSWAAGPNPAAQLWTRIAGEYVPPDRLDNAFRAHIPWDDWFAHPANITGALHASGLMSVAVDTREYRFTMTTSEYVQSREASVQGLVLREACAPQRWNEFTHQVAGVFRERFGGTVEYRREVHFGIGTRPR